MKRGQVWVETVIYTLIAFIMIGLVLSFVKPKIEQIQDRGIIEQSIGMIENMDLIILSLEEGGQGNKRLVEIGIKKGVLNLDGENNKIIFEMESKEIYSEPGRKVYYGDLIVYTEKRAGYNIVTLTRDYTGRYNITYQGNDELKSFTKSSTPYKLFFSNKGGNPTTIDVEMS